MLTDRARCCGATTCTPCAPATHYARARALSALNLDVRRKFERTQALEQLGEMVGAVYTDDLLDRIFSRFCIGK